MIQKPQMERIDQLGFSSPLSTTRKWAGGSALCRDLDTTFFPSFSPCPGLTSISSKHQGLLRRRGEGDEDEDATGCMHTLPLIPLAGTQPQGQASTLGETDGERSLPAEQPGPPPVPILWKFCHQKQERGDGGQRTFSTMLRDHGK